MDKLAGWISVEDRLPENSDWVVVWYRDKDGDFFPAVGKYIEWKPTGQKYWYTDVDNNDSAYPPEEITHWMPLPAAPTQSKKAGE